MYKLGVVGVIPFWSQSDNLNTDSNYCYLRMILPKFLEKTENTVFLVFFPDPKIGSGNWIYTPDGLENDRIKFIPWPYDTAMRSGVLGFDPHRFAQVEKEYGPNIYWLNQVESGAQISGGYRQGFNKEAQPTLIAQHHYIIHKSLPYPIDPMFSRRWAQMGGSIASHRVIYNSEHTKRMADESFGELLNKKTMDKLDDKSKVLKFGFVDDYYPIAPEANDEKPVFIYNHRFEGYKNPDITFDIIHRLKEKFDFEVHASQVNGQKTSRYKIDRNIFAVDREQYLNNIAIPAVNTINSSHETFCISALDSIAVGNIVVLPNSVTFPELVPANYPFLFNDTDEQEAMLTEILRTWPLHYNKWRLPLIEHGRANFNIDDYADNYLNLIADEEDQAIVKMKEHNKTAVEQVINDMKKGKNYRVSDIHKNILKVSSMSIQSFPLNRMNRILARRTDIQIFIKNAIYCKKS